MKAQKKNEKQPMYRGQTLLNPLLGSLLILLFTGCVPSRVQSLKEEGGTGGTVTGTGSVQTQTAVASGSENDNTVTSVTVLAAAGTFFSKFIVDLGAEFTRANICAGKTIFGRLGTSACITPVRNFHDIGSSTSTRIIPVVNKDHDGFYTGGTGNDPAGNPNVDNTMTPADTSSITSCGTTQASVKARIADCNYSWDGAVRGNNGHGLWTLVTKMVSGSEVWQDDNTQRIWTGDLGANYWCQAAGNTENSGDSNQGWSIDCTPGAGAGFQPSTPVSMCAEASGLNSDGFDDFKGNMRLAASPSSPAVAWRLPSREDSVQALVDGANFITADFRNGAAFWTATVYSWNRDRAYYISTSRTAVFDGTDRAQNTIHVRCIGEAL